MPEKITLTYDTDRVPVVVLEKKYNLFIIILINLLQVCKVYLIPNTGKGTESCTSCYHGYSKNKRWWKTAHAAINMLYI